MKSKAKKLVGMLLVLVMMLSLAACGGKDKDESTGGSGGKSDDVTTIKITWWGSDARHAYTQELLDLYTEKNPNIKFEATPSGWDGYFDKLSTQAASGSMPDIIQMDYGYIATYSTNNSLADMTEFIDDGTIDVSSIEDTILSSGEIDGKVTGIPAASTMLAVNYNPVAIEAAGATAPTDDWTWEDYIAMNKKVSEKTGQPSALNSITGAFGNVNLLNYWVRQQGEVLYNEDNTALGYDDDELTASYFQMWADMAKDGVAPDPDQQSQLASVGKESLPIMEDQAASTIEWNNFASMMSGSNDTLKLALMPESKENNALWLKPSMFLSIAENSKVKEEAAKFIDWFINSEEANDIIAAERGTPISAKVREYMVASGKMTPQQEEMFEYTDKVAEIAGDCPPADPNGQAEIDEAFANAGNSVMYGEATAKEAAKTFRTQANEILERNNKK